MGIIACGIAETRIGRGCSRVIDQAEIKLRFAKAHLNYSPTAWEKAVLDYNFTRKTICPPTLWEKAVFEFDRSKGIPAPLRAWERAEFEFRSSGAGTPSPIS